MPLRIGRHVSGRERLDRVTRYNLYPAVEVLGDMTPGTSFGQGMDTMEALRHARCPRAFLTSGPSWPSSNSKRATPQRTSLSLRLSSCFSCLPGGTRA